MKQMQTLVHHFQELLGIKLYLVGGSVRDMLLEIPHTDLDFATPSPPEDIEEAVRKAGLKPLTMGKRFGTIAFNYKKEIPLTTNYKLPTTNYQLQTPPSKSPPSAPRPIRTHASPRWNS